MRALQALSIIAIVLMVIIITFSGFISLLDAYANVTANATQTAINKWINIGGSMGKVVAIIFGFTTLMMIPKVLKEE